MANGYAPNNPSKNSICRLVSLAQTPMSAVAVFTATLTSLTPDGVVPPSDTV